MKSKLILLFVYASITLSCNNFLDVIPDEIPTIDHVFRSRLTTETMLFTCYSYLPNPADFNGNPALMSSRECWFTTQGLDFVGGTNPPAWNIARGRHSAANPALDYWNGSNGGVNLFVALRDCNIFLDNVDRPVDLEEYEKKRWVAEVKFLKAYYHFYLLRMYGPVPIIRENIPVSATPEEVKVYREPVEEVAQYIVELLDEAAPDLPLTIQNQTNELGRITRPIALALKAKTLVLMASPIFNGNPYYANIKDNRGKYLFPRDEDRSKWTKAAAALDTAIKSAHLAGHTLYYHTGDVSLSNNTKAKMNLRGAVTQRWNKEIIWGSTKDNFGIQAISAVRTNNNQLGSSVISMMSPALEVVERFYSKRGVPIEEDKFYDYENRYLTRQVSGGEYQHLMTDGYTTARLNFDREMRFYSSLCFDGSVLYGNGYKDQDVAAYVQMKKGGAGGMIAAEKYSITGYLPKKLVSIETSVSDMGFSTYRYTFPYIRLADLYLMYAEALNEVKNTPDSEVFYWIDEVRRRAQLDDVVYSWINYSTKPETVETQSGVRRIIHRERYNEFAFEGPAYWDMLRWHEAEDFMNRPVKGWNIRGENNEDYYKVLTIFAPSFLKRDYLAPIKLEILDRNSNLIQNPGWDSY
ncbi:MAG: RagB/SusD family nutrient uptake outer membrane protein [Prevotellaceae bacterium]|jgi:hypothetical protein|nr:RagB/SusD family nutrient uptake outer membrane protein [Prevotellaceae bacterium]